LGSPMYMSPEIVLREDYDRRCDVWAVGIIVYILITGYPPFFADAREDLNEAIVNQEIDFDDEIFEKVSPDCIDFIQKCLEKRQEDRPFVSELLQHKWMNHCEEEQLNQESRVKFANNLAQFRQIDAF
jgi:calcium-dependent protein kinase